MQQDAAVIAGARGATNGLMAKVLESHLGERVSMTMLAGQIQAARRGIDHNVPITIGIAPYLRANLDPLFQSERGKSLEFSAWIESNLLKTTVPHGSWVALIAQRNAALRASFGLYDGSIAAMDEVLERRIAAAQHGELTAFAIVLVAIVAAGGLMLATTRSMARQIADKVALEHEIVERAVVEKQLAYAAFHDELTGLSNRALLMDRLEQIAMERHAEAHLWPILFMDLDRFKVVNDSLGHHSGDLVLIEAARRLADCLRADDTLARLGGDEFVILLDGIADVPEAYAVARRVLLPFGRRDRRDHSDRRVGLARSVPPITSLVRDHTSDIRPIHERQRFRYAAHGARIRANRRERFERFRGTRRLDQCRGHRERVTD